MIDRRRALQIIDATLKHAGFREVGPGIADYEGQIKVHGKPVNIGLSIPDVRFTRRPQVHLKDRSQVPVAVLAHVETETGICYASAVGLPVDLYEPGQAILRVLEEARRTLERSYAGKGKADVIDEYQNYWRESLPIRCFRPRTAQPADASLKAFFAHYEGEPRFVALAQEAKLRGYQVTLPSEAVIWHSDEPLRPSDDVFVPKNLAQLKIWFEAQPGLQKRGWVTAYNTLLSEKYLLFAAPNAFLGTELKMPSHISNAVKKNAIRKSFLPGLLGKMADRVAIDRYSGRWSSLEDITARNNPNVARLSELKIALVGCGTIGSHLARFLIQSGAGQKHPLVLFDSEILMEGNLGRHLLGFADIGRAKASALAGELERFHPQVSVRPIDDDVMPHLGSLEGYDLVVDATGDWNMQSALNDWFMAPHVRRPRALLHSWVFMNGAAVQSFLNLRDRYACFRCLKPAFDGPWRYPAGDPSEPLNLQPATCGDGAYVPFSVDVSVTAAGLSNRAALDFARGEPGYRLRTAVTDFDRGRFQKPRSPDPSPHCPACSALREQH